jgi:hypothetical protein
MQGRLVPTVLALAAVSAWGFSRLHAAGPAAIPEPEMVGEGVLSTQPLQNLGPRVNSTARDYSPRLSPDGRYLFFASERGLPNQDRRPGTYRELMAAMKDTLNGLGNIYQIDLKVALGK